jgi:hypothetical protein
MTLADRIALHRQLYADDLHISRLVQRQPPLTPYRRGDFTEPAPDPWDGPLMEHLQRIETRRQFSMRMQSRVGADEELVVEPGAAVGMPLSGRLLRYVSHPEGFGAEFPWTRALFRLKYHCRREHPFHRAGDRPYWRGSLCWSLVQMCVIREFSIENAAKILRYDNPEPLVRYALTWIEREMDRARELAERRAREDAGRGPGAVPSPTVEQRHDQPGLHRSDCPKCRRESAA